MGCKCTRGGRGMGGGMRTVIGEVRAHSRGCDRAIGRRQWRTAWTEQGASTLGMGGGLDKA